jgi:hypothetical protein
MALMIARPIRTEAIAGPTIDKARLVDGAKAQKPGATRPRIEVSPGGRDRGTKKPNARARDWSVATNGRWVRESLKAFAPVRPEQSCEGSQIP